MILLESFKVNSPIGTTISIVLLNKVISVQRDIARDVDAIIENYLPYVTNADQIKYLRSLNGMYVDYEEYVRSTLLDIDYAEGALND